jgi:uncharacterized protein with beta-barrel porin domain
MTGDLARFRFGNFTEESDGILGLTFDSSIATSVVSSLGVQFDTRLALSNGEFADNSQSYAGNAGVRVLW